MLNALVCGRCGVGNAGEGKKAASRAPYAGAVNPLSYQSQYELVVADDGTIPAEQLRNFGFLPGAHLRVVEATGEPISDRLAGSLPDLPDLEWEDFERGSELARRDASASCA